MFTQHNPFVGDLEKFGNDKRSVYLLQQRFRPNPYLDLFDGADANNATAARVNNTTALQALYMMNDAFVEAQAKALSRESQYRGGDFAGEAAAGLSSSLWPHAYAGREPDGTRFPAEGRRREETATSAWTGLMRVLLSSNEFFYVD